MEIKMFDKVRLKTGEIGNIVEIFDNGVAFLVDINQDDWGREVKLEDIDCIIEG